MSSLGVINVQFSSLMQGN